MPRALPTRSLSGPMSVGCGVLFFSIFAIAGLFAGIAMFAGADRVFGPWTTWRESTCEVPAPTGDALPSSADLDEQQAWIAAHPPPPDGEPVPTIRVHCWVDPDDATDFVTERRLQPEMAIALLPLIFLTVGLGGIVMSIRGGLRTKRREPALAWVPELVVAQGAAGYDWGAGQSRWGSAVGLLLFAVFWNGISSIPIAMAMLGKLEDDQWFVGLIGAVFGLVGLVILFAGFRAFLVAIRVPLASITAQRASLEPGRSVDIVVTQHGAFDVSKATLTARCEEAATYRVGTDTRTERAVTWEQTIAETGPQRVDVGRPLELRARLAVPDDAMHSFKGARNQVGWELVLHVEIDRWPDVHRTVSFLVLPTGVVAPGER